MSADPYITVEEADAFAEAEAAPSLAALLALWNALADEGKEALLTEASDQIDSVRWQGRRYDTDPEVQAREFPRVVAELPAISDAPASLTSAGTVWDWDSDAQAAVVPERVERATWCQALSLLDPARAARLDDRHDGVASQSGGGASESYDAARPAEVLCRRAWALLGRYRLRTGGMV